MGHAVRLFAGPKLALRPFLEALPGACAYALTPLAPAYVLPVDDDILDALHARNGTGEWLDAPSHPKAAPPRLTTTDVDFAQRASAGTALAYLETEYFGGTGWQSAAVWIDGRTAMRAALAHSSENRAAKLLPINGALKLLGVTAHYTSPIDDAFSAFGLARYRDVEAIRERGLPVQWS